MSFVTCPEAINLAKDAYVLKVEILCERFGGQRIRNYAPRYIEFQYEQMIGRDALGLHADRQPPE